MAAEDTPRARHMRDQAIAAPREERVGETRRRRVGERGIQAKMAVPPEMLEPGGVLDPKKWVARWIIDRGNRLYDLTKRDDYELVTSDGTAGDVDNPGLIRYLHGSEGGSPVYSYLCRKLKAYADHDRAEDLRLKVDEPMKVRMSGASGDEPEESYTPKR